MRKRIIGAWAAGVVCAAAMTGGGVALVADAPGPTPITSTASTTTTSPTASPSSPSPASSPVPVVAATGSTPGGGRIERVVIPATVSRFPARSAYVYLPPAALRAGEGRFPVVIALAGQSRGAGPGDVIVKGHLARIMDAIAGRHHGRAPIVVVPDQLGPGSPNPMCIDSPLGRVATYITVDVRRWVLRTLPADADRRDWTIAGFSEGGTCAIQFAAGYPRLFGSLIDVSGEVAPKNGSVAHTIAVGFAGSRAAYERATPFALLRASAPFPPTRAEFAVGALDTHYGAVAPLMAQHARAAGMQVDLRKLPGVKHNWTMATMALQWGLDRLASWWTLDRPTSR